MINSYISVINLLNLYLLLVVSLNTDQNNTGNHRNAFSFFVKVSLFDRRNLTFRINCYKL